MVTTTDASWRSQWYDAEETVVQKDDPKPRGGFEYLYQIDRNETENRFTWNGNLWTPPDDFPLLSGREIKHLFANENTLWIGDSTSRQDMQTMYAQINAIEPNNVHLYLVIRFINKGKRSRTAFHCPRRTPPLENMEKFGCERPCAGGVQYVEMAQVRGTDSQCTVDDADTDTDNSENNNDNGGGDAADSDEHNDAIDPEDSAVVNATDPFAIGKFDVSNTACFLGLKDLIQKENTNVTIRSNYTVLVVSLGIWEVVRPDCNDPTTTRAERQRQALEALHAFSGPDMFIVFKTVGPSDTESGNLGLASWELIRGAEEWFLDVQPEYMDLVDFGREILEANRTFGSERIAGDLKPHWGFAARAMSNGMVAHAVLLNQERRRKNRKAESNEQ